MLSGKVHLYREGVHFEYDGKKMLRQGDIIQTMDDSTIMLEIANMQIAIAPNTYFELDPGENRFHIEIGKLIHGNVYTNLATIRTDKPYLLFGPQYKSIVKRSEVLYSVARNRRELMNMLKGKKVPVFKVLSDTKTLANSATLTTQITVFSGEADVELQDKKVEKIKKGHLLEFRAEGVAIKNKPFTPEAGAGYLSNLKFKLPSLQGQQ